MIKIGYRLYAVRVYRDTFRKQAKNPDQFVRLCLEEERARGYDPPRKFWYLYKPDFVYDENRKVWLSSDGSVYGTHLPPGF